MPTHRSTTMWRYSIVAGLLATHAVLLAWSAYRHSPTIDEVGHLPAGIYGWHYGRFDVYNVNPPLVRTLAALPVVLARPKTAWYGVGVQHRPEWYLGRRFIEANGEKAFLYFTWARWACIPLSLFGGWVCFRWATDLYGAPSGILALMLWCFSPNIVANASMITPDAGATAVGIAAHYAFWRWLSGPTWKQAIIAGLLLGLAELTKATWIVLFVVWPALALIWFVGKNAPRRGRRRKVIGQGALMLVLGLYVLNVGFGFEGTFRRLGEFRFRSSALTSAADGPAGNRFAETMFESIPVPLPSSYVRGIDEQKADFEDGKWSYLNGEHRFGGWWYFYLYALAIKVPLGTWLLFCLAVWATATHRAGFSAGWRNEMLLLVPAVVILALVSSQTGFSRYLRYALPLFPFVFIWISKVARSVACGRRGTATAAGAALAWSCASSLVVYPHSLSYFNELAGGPRWGHRYLIDASIDWGQDRSYLRRWVECHPEASPLHAECYGALGLEYFGIDARDIPARPTPGWYAISVHCLHHRSGRRRWLLEREPTEIVTWSIYVYHVTSDEISAGKEPERVSMRRAGASDVVTSGRVSADAGTIPASE